MKLANYKTFALVITEINTNIILYLKFKSKENCQYVEMICLKMASASFIH